MRYLYLKLSLLTLLGTLQLYTFSQETIRDVDGNVYKTVVIGNQVWLAENLRTTRFNDSTKISLKATNIDWSHADSPAFCWYQNDSASYNVPYGILYNWYTIDTKKLCPIGWHVPDNYEWSTLIAYLGREEAVYKLKEAGTKHWIKPNKKANNESGFTAVPGGFRSYHGGFSLIGENSGWWSTDEKSPYWSMSNFDSYLTASFADKQVGSSVRCIKD